MPVHEVVEALEVSVYSARFSRHALLLARIGSYELYAG
jgi:hypothetical protein